MTEADTIRAELARLARQLADIEAAERAAATEADRGENYAQVVCVWCAGTAQSEHSGVLMEGESRPCDKCRGTGFQTARLFNDGVRRYDMALDTREE